MGIKSPHLYTAESLGCLPTLSASGSLSSSITHLLCLHPHLREHLIVLVLDVIAMTLNVRTLFYTANELGWIASHYRVFLHVLETLSARDHFAILELAYLCHDRAGANHSASANRPEWQDSDIAANEDVCTHVYCASRHQTLGTTAAPSLDVGRDAVELDVRTHHRPVANSYLTGILHVAASLDDDLFAEMDVVSVLASEGRLHNRTRADEASRPTVRFSVQPAEAWSAGRVGDGFEEAAAFLEADARRGSCGIMVPLERAFALLLVIQQLVAVEVLERSAQQHVVAVAHVSAGIVGERERSCAL